MGERESQNVKLSCLHFKAIMSKLVIAMSTLIRLLASFSHACLVCSNGDLMLKIINQCKCYLNADKYFLFSVHKFKLSIVTLTNYFDDVVSQK